MVIGLHRRLVGTRDASFRSRQFQTMSSTAKNRLDSCAFANRSLHDASRSGEMDSFSTIAFPTTPTAPFRKDLTRPAAESRTVKRSTRYRLSKNMFIYVTHVYERAVVRFGRHGKFQLGQFLNGILCANDGATD